MGVKSNQQRKEKMQRWIAEKNKQVKREMQEMDGLQRRNKQVEKKDGEPKTEMHTSKQK